MKVRFAKGKVVHLAHGASFGSAYVVCNKVPSWHKNFTILDESEEVTCPTCKSRMRRTF